MKNDLGKKLNLYLRSEKMLLNLEIKKKTNQTVFVVVGMIALLSTLVLLNISAYFYLDEHMKPQSSALLLAVANMLIAVVFFLVAKNQSLGSEAKTIEEIRDLSLDELSQELESFKTVFNRDLLGIKGIIPFVNLLLEIKKHKKQE